MVNLLLAVVTAVVIVLAMNLVGSLLISALVIFPAVSAHAGLPQLQGSYPLRGSAVGGVRLPGA